MSAVSPAIDRLHDLGPVDQIPLGEGREVQASGIRIAVFRTRAGEVFATQAECPHRGGPLADGLLGGRAVVCPLHEFKFDLVTGTPIGTQCEPLRTFTVRVDGRGHLLLAS